MRIDRGVRDLIRLALAEDLGRRGDVTTRFFLPRGRYRARLVFKEAGVLCGRDVFDEVFRLAAPGSRVAWRAREGQRLAKGATAAVVTGPAAILTAERTALNFLQKLSGIATLTRRYADAVRGTRAKVYDTRKTPPGWRSLCKHAVRCGGGENHRMGLYDMALVKDNHLAGLAGADARRRVSEFRRRHPGIPVEFEAADLAQVRLALDAGADMVLLDNMPPARIKAAVRLLRRAAPGVKIEVSGGVDLRTIRRLARLGPDRISVGRITHSAPALDVSLKLE